MPTFTMRLCDLIDSGFDIGMKTTTDYPIFDEAYRPVLNQRITDHYALYEIGHETPSMFKFALNRRLREIMKYYNQLYLSEKIVFDPLSTLDYTDDATSTNAVNSSQNATNTNTVNTSQNTTNESTVNSTQNNTNHNTNDTSSRARVVNSELPQVHLSPNEDYASSGADTASDTTATGDGTSTTTGTDTTNGTSTATGTDTANGASTTTGTDTANGTVNHTTQGRQGPAATLLMNYRASLLNIDLMVIRDCADLFMGVWNTNDEYSTHGRMYGSVFVADGYPEI